MFTVSKPSVSVWIGYNDKSLETNSNNKTKMRFLLCFLLRFTVLVCQFTRASVRCVRWE